MSITLGLNLLLFVIFLLFTYNRLKRNYKLFYLLLLFYIQGFNMMTSLIYIEEGIYIHEQGKDSYFVGSVFFYFLFFIVTIYLCEKTITYLDKYLNFTDIKFSFLGAEIGGKFALMLVSLVLFLLYINVYLSPSPLFDKGVTRFTYWESSKLKFLNSIFGNTSIFIPFTLGLVYRKYKKISVVILLLYFVNMILIGQKFSPLVSGLYSFFFPLVLMSNNNNYKISIKKFINYKVLSVFVLVFSIVYYKYSLLNPFTHLGVETPFQAIIYRAFGLQAHLFWGCVENFVILELDKSWNIADLNYGMHHLMRHFYPGNSEQLNNAIQSGYSFTNAYPAILFYIFPVYLVYIIHAILMILLLGPLMWFLKRMIQGSNILFSLIAFQLFSWVVYTFKMGYFYKLLLPLLFFFMISTVIYFIKQTKNNDKIM
ncbi:DUF6418 domain-containing protein [Algibacter sp. L3A6]|uniref:DUF6418 domain-containing protein n=1 Tax=Algibacter sp. L3A6 TaxID=2686366 RepID=UPI00131C94BD|nr:DUF6418 domain-containing protein [Algibacter sp. L3A6]